VKEPPEQVDNSFMASVNGDGRPDLIVAGDVMLDVAVAGPALVRGGDVHGEVLIRTGGSGANAAVWAAWAGATVHLYGRVGDDLAGRLLLEALRERGVEPRLAVDHEAPTGAMLVVRNRGDRSMVASRGANGNLLPTDLPDRLEARAVLLSGYLLFHARAQPAALAVMQRSAADILAVDPSSWPLLEDFGGEKFLEATEACTMLLANQEEAVTLTGATGEEAARHLSWRYVVAVVKQAARGALLGRGGHVIHAPSPMVDEGDPTGAGDAFNGVLLASLIQGYPEEVALARACRAGAAAASSLEAWPAADLSTDLLSGVGGSAPVEEEPPVSSSWAADLLGDESPA
jgi:sugar/nucleoside kinase (ribokinase family)